MLVCSPSSDLAFSQVREDPLLEYDIVERLAQRQQHPLRILLVASGGCTALTLLAHPAVGEVIAVDLSPAQLHLVELRRQALMHLSLAEQQRFIGADLVPDSTPDLITPEAERLRLYDSLRGHLPSATQAFWDARLAQIGFGVNRVGRFEQLFRELAHAFTILGLDPLEDP